MKRQPLLEMLKRWKRTGQIITRVTKDKAPTNDGRVVLIVYGLLAVDPSDPLNAEGMQWNIAGDNASNVLRIDDNPTDQKEATTGQTIGSVLCTPIWRFMR